MPATMLAQTITVTRNGPTNNFQFLVHAPNGGVRYAFALLQADMATAAALGNAASVTFTYGQDGVSPTGPTRNDLPSSYATETF